MPPCAFTWFTYAVAPTMVCSPRNLAGPSSAEQDPIRIWVSVTPGVLVWAWPRQDTNTASKNRLLPTCNFINVSPPSCTLGFYCDYYRRQDLNAASFSCLKASTLQTSRADGRKIWLCFPVVSDTSVMPAAYFADLQRS